MGRFPNATSADRARTVTGSAGGDGSEYATTIDVMRADGGGHNGAIVLRIHEIYTNRDEIVFGEQHSETTRCYGYTWENSPVPAGPVTVSCPDFQPIVLPPETPVPKLPDEADARLRTILTNLAASHDDNLDPVRAELARAFPDPGIVIEVTEVGGVVGVSVAAGSSTVPYATPVCLLGRALVNPNIEIRRRAAPTMGPDLVEVWSEPTVLANPNEWGCRPGTAAYGEAKNPPH
ncbi:hypothetical protein [Pseudofrankia asymbiotica]|uniref:Uncharacterized protein n=1 Tax=Pseudofrankia asymbiotica TaxID=1834516 RepID=A0A1V2I887_9ACTN|nr:hypothetical protein [Pseudofrankia asymbiotica]ONH28441.1 hypothetical protein BL253_19885 [Pseudofrankia asymbiotica]